jgi:uncharacterized membrane protein
MRIFTSRIFWGLVLILGGVLFLLENLGVFQGSALFWGICLVVAGLLFIVYYLANRQQWWALFPGIILASIGVMLCVVSFVPGVEGLLGGTIVLSGIGLSFFIVYLANRSAWWAIIPGGVLVTLAIVAALDTTGSDTLTAGVFFLGLGLTFLLIALVPSTTGSMKWAWIPAGVLSLLGLIVMLASEELWIYILPLGLCIAGGFLIWRAIRAH